MQRKVKTEETNLCRLECQVPVVALNVLEKVREAYREDLNVRKVSWGNLLSILAVQYDPSIRTPLEEAGFKIPEKFL